MILLVIAYLTLFGLIVGERGKAGLPARPLDATVEALRRTLDFLINHPITYHWHRQDLLAPGLVLTLFGRSAALLLLSLFVATLIGVPLGITVALLRRVRMAPLVLLLSVLGVSTPSFLLGMLFWMIDVQVYRWLRLSSAPLPPTGFGWDAHVVMPALVLATRPLAQIVQITYVSLSNVLSEDYIRTAHAKGLGRGVVINRHALRNILIPILTTLGTSLRFSLASLPVVEAFFNWPGVGLTLLQAIESGLAPLVTDLIVSLGFLFLLINLALDVVYQVIDPRLRAGAQAETQMEARRTWRERWDELRLQISDLKSQISGLKSKVPWIHPERPSILPKRILGLRRQPVPSHLSPDTSHQSPDNQPTANHHPLTTGRRSPWRMLGSILSNFPLLLGTPLVLAFLSLTVLGKQLTSASPYETHGVMTIEEKVGVPPFVPSTVFPWGSDAVGRDIQALVLVGAKQTLTLALLGMLARMAVGTVLGVSAGWWRGGWLDRLISGAVAVWAAFPVTLFAMILILALGIKQGVSVFVIALCVVGWGEIAQFVRGQVTSLKPQPYIEAAQALGARTGWILTRHVLPHLWAPLLVLAVLELGSVLMLLAELGFLNIFLGGGFKAEIGEVGKMVPVIYYFSDVPEWGALLANIRNWWRSYPWLAWYPGVAFFMAILALNLWGEGLRRFLEDSRVNIGRLINRYTVIAVGVAVLGGVWLVHTTAPIEMYHGQAQQFDVERAMEDIRTLASPEFQGRESGTPGAELTADYIAARMKEIGLFPAGENGTYFHAIPAPRAHLADVPRLEILSNITGEVAGTLAYRQDFVEYTGYHLRPQIEKEGAIVGLAVGPDPDEGMSFNLRQLDLRGKIILVREADFERLAGEAAEMAGVLIVNDDPDMLQRRYLFPPPIYTYHYYFDMPMMYVTPEVADQLLATASSGLAQLDVLAQNLASSQLAWTEPGTRVRMAVPTAPDNLDEKYEYVIGFIPGTGALMGEKEKGEEVFGENAIKGLDSNVIIVSAYYDGLGVGPDGTLYPSANDNASGVAVMLEMARALKASSSQPRKTIVFVAWSSGERREGFSVAYAMNAKHGFNLLTVESVIELSGVGDGSGTGIALGQGTSFSLVQLFQDAARRVGVPVTTRGRGPHFGVDIQSGFGGRSALTAYVSWDGSDQAAHTAADTFEAVDPNKLRSVGQTTLLVVSVLGQIEAQNLRWDR
jgi:ABC-type dipeptide/oligopeptide/nickel transport system permease component